MKIETGVDCADHRLLCPTVGDGEPAEGVRFVDGRVELFHGVGGAARNGSFCPATGSHDLDVVGALVDEPADRPTQFGLAVGNLVAPVKVPSGAGDRAAAEKETRTRVVAPLQPFAKEKSSPVTRAVVA